MKNIKVLRITILNIIKVKNFSVIKLKSMRYYGFTGVNIEYEGSLFIITVPIDKKEPEFTYQVTEEIVKTKHAIYDVTCKYKNKLFGFEIGHSSHNGRKHILVLDYKYLNLASYIDIKKRIRKFLKKSLEN